MADQQVPSQGGGGQPAQQPQAYPQQQYQQQPQAYPQQQYQQQGYPQQQPQYPPQYQQAYPQQQYAQQAQYQQQYAPQPQYQQPVATAPAKPKLNVWGIVAIACGGLALVASPTLAGGVILGIAGVAFGVLGLVRPRRALAIAGTACGAAAIIASIVFLNLGWSIFGGFRLIQVSREAPDTEATAITIRNSVTDRHFDEAQNLKPYEVADDNMLFLELLRISFDQEGNLVFYANMTMMADADYLWLDAPPLTWTVNDTAVEPVINTTLYMGDFDRTNCFFYIPADQLEGIDDLESIYSIRGTIRCTSYIDGEKDDVNQYTVAL